MASYEELRSYARIIRNETKSSANTALRIGEMYLNIIDKMEDVDDRFKDFLTGTDTDNIINRWKELESFLNGYTETSTLADLLSGKADKATTLAGYGITNAYTKVEVDGKITSVNTSVTTLQTTVSGHTTSINSLQNTVSGHTSSITSINSDITALQSYFTKGVANSALRLSNGAEYKAWGQVFFKDGKPVDVSGEGTFTQVNADSVLLRGKARLSYDSNLNALLLTKNDGTAVHFIASGAVATRGLGEIEEGGGGTGTGVDLLNVPSDIIPIVGGSYSLGTSGKAWKTIYANNGAIGSLGLYEGGVISNGYIKSINNSWVINPDGGASFSSLTINGANAATQNWVNSQDFAKASDLSNYATINTEQTISGKKTFTGGITVDKGITASQLYSVGYLDSSELIINAEKVNFIYDGDDADVQIGLLNGYKPLTLGNTSFSPALTSGTVIGTITIGGESKTIYAPSGGSADLSNYVTLDSEQTITGSKYFSDLNANIIYLQGFELKPYNPNGDIPDRLMYDGYVLLDEYNYSEYLDSAYVKKSGDTVTGKLGFTGSTYPHIYGNGNYLILAGASNETVKSVIIEKYGFRPYTNNNMPLGISGNRWSNVYSVKGDFSGQITSTVADGTAPFVVASKTLVSNLNADMLDGLHADSFDKVYTSSFTVTESGWYRLVNVPTNSSNLAWKDKYIVVNTTSAAGSSCSSSFKILYSTQQGWSVTYNNDFIVIPLTRTNSKSVGNVRLLSATGNNARYIDVYIALPSGTTAIGVAMRSNISSTCLASEATLSFDDVSSFTVIERNADPLSGRTIGGLIAEKATKLSTARTLWGQSFDGSGNVSGNLIGVRTIEAASLLELISTNGDIYLKRNNTNSTSVVLNGSSFKPFFAANGLLDLGSSTARWKGIYGQSLDLSGGATIGGSLTTGGNILPSTDKSYSLGATNNRWAGIYGNTLDLSGNATIGGETVATQVWVNSQSFAKTSDLTSINNSISSLQASTFTGANAPEGKGYTLTWFTQSGGGRNVTIPTFGSLGYESIDDYYDKNGLESFLVDGKLMDSLLIYIEDAISAGGQVDLSNYATINTEQTISGKKTFTGGITVQNGITASHLYSVGYLDSSELIINAEKVNFIYDGDDADVQIGLLNGYKPLTLGNTSFTSTYTGGIAIGAIKIGDVVKTIYAPSGGSDLSYITQDVTISVNPEDIDQASFRLYFGDGGNIFGMYTDDGRELNLDADVVYAAMVGVLHTELLRCYEVIQMSDIRYKNIKESIHLELSDIAAAPTFRFNWNDKDNKKNYVGSSAQYWQSLVEEFVVEDKKTGKLGLDYSTAALVSAISIAREVNTMKMWQTSTTDRIEELEDKVKKLEAENKALRELLNSK